jgi:hypothetical protein
MSDDGYEDGPPSYTFLTEEPAEEYRILAEMHRKEAKQLLERAQEAEAEGRQEEAKLLIDVSASRQERAGDLDKTARGEADDPSVTEAIDGQLEVLSTYTPHSMAFFKEDELPPATLPVHMRPREPGPILRTWAKITGKFKKKSADPAASAPVAGSAATGPAAALHK